MHTYNYTEYLYVNSNVVRTAKMLPKDFSLHINQMICQGLQKDNIL